MRVCINCCRNWNAVYGVCIGTVVPCTKLHWKRCNAFDVGFLVHPLDG